MALSKDPQQRFGSVQAFAHALAQAAGITTVISLPFLAPSVQSSKPAPDVVTQQAGQVTVASTSKRSDTPPVQLIPTPPVLSSLTPPMQQERPKSASSPVRNLIIKRISFSRAKT